MAKVGRNQPCTCGSGKKYKKCCARKDAELRRVEQEAEQFERDVRNGVIDPFASNEDWEVDPEDQWEPDPENDDWSDESDDSGEFDDWIDDDLDDDEMSDHESDDFPESLAKHLPEEDEKVISAWWKTFYDIEDPKELRKHIESLMDEHPDLIKESDLDIEPLYQLEHLCNASGCNEEYIELLLRFRLEFPDSYEVEFSTFDYNIIRWLIGNGKKEQVPEFLNLFIKDPMADPEKLLELLDLLMSCNSQDILLDFLQKISEDVCNSEYFLEANDILSLLTLQAMIPFLDAGLDTFDAKKLAEKLRILEDVLHPDWFEPEFLSERVQATLGTHKGWSIDDCSTHRQAYEQYDSITRNFMGWLHTHKSLDWCAAEFFRLLMRDYLTEALPLHKKPRKSFPLDPKDIEWLIGRMLQNFMIVNHTDVFATLNSMYWFSEFLEDTQSIDSEKAQDTRKACTELFKLSYNTKDNTDSTAGLWQDFPRKM